MRACEGKFGGVRATTSWNRQRDVAGVETELIKEGKKLQLIERAEGDRRPGGGRLNRNRDWGRTGEAR